MSRITTTHKGMDIHWAENEDAWSCMELKYSSPSLSKVKKRIDVFRKKERDSITYKAVYLGTFNNKFEEVEIVEYLGESKRSYAKGHKVAVMRVSGFKGRRSRNEDRLNELALDLPEVHAKGREIKEIEAQIDALNTRKREIFDSIPRLTLDDIPELVAYREKMKEAENTE
jgi:cation transport regulator ChaC